MQECEFRSALVRLHAQKMCFGFSVPGSGIADQNAIPEKLIGIRRLKKTIV
jgi:hypothetical protein